LGWGWVMSGCLRRTVAMAANAKGTMDIWQGFEKLNAHLCMIISTLLDINEVK
jgi:hypothetical protein